MQKLLSSRNYTGAGAWKGYAVNGGPRLDAHVITLLANVACTFPDIKIGREVAGINSVITAGR